MKKLLTLTIATIIAIIFFLLINSNIKTKEYIQTIDEPYFGPNQNQQIRFDRSPKLNQ